jgi:pantetheine-phosphate adenylyltransferase
MSASTRHLVAIYPGTFDPSPTATSTSSNAASASPTNSSSPSSAMNTRAPSSPSTSAWPCSPKPPAHYDNVEIDSFDGLLVDFARRRKRRSFCAASAPSPTMNTNLQMALMNRRLAPNIETMFMMAGEAYSFISSRLVKEVFRLGGEIAGMVPPGVEARLRQRLPPAREGPPPSAGCQRQSRKKIIAVSCKLRHPRRPGSR